MTLRSYGASDIGRVRAENEDSFLCDEKLGLYAVADGIGGLPAGAQASQMAIESLVQVFSRPPELRGRDYHECLDEINRRVYLLGRRLSERFGIGTTLTFVHVEDTTLHIVHVGDSHLFRFRAGRTETLTIEHNLETEAKMRAARGEPVGMMFENKLALTRCVGQPPPLEGDYARTEIRPGDRLLLCSDGITRLQTTREIAASLKEADDPKAWVHALINRSNERGGYDNSTGVALFFD